MCFRQSSHPLANFPQKFLRRWKSCGYHVSQHILLQYTWLVGNLNRLSFFKAVYFVILALSPCRLFLTDTQFLAAEHYPSILRVLLIFVSFDRLQPLQP